MHIFHYHQATSIDDALQILKKNNAMILAGGQYIVPKIKQQRLQIDRLVDISAIQDFHNIFVKDGCLIIGAMATHRQIETSPVIRQTIPSLSDLAKQSAYIQTRSCGTIGGAIAVNHMPQHYPVACVGLNASIMTDRRQISADVFFKKTSATPLQKNEIITHLSFPIPDHASYQAFTWPNASDHPLVSVMVARARRNVSVVMATNGKDSTIRHIAELEQALKKNFSADQAYQIKLPESDFASEINGLHINARYLAHLACILTARAIIRIG
ncbi:MAG: FAD binding domain-containing protein [Pseudomonadota bacterium]